MKISELVAEFGYKNIRIFMPRLRMHRLGFLDARVPVRNAPAEVVECVITIDTYDPTEDYKITVSPIDPDFNREHFYTMDFDTMARSKDQYGIRVYTLADDNYYTRVNFQ